MSFFADLLGGAALTGEKILGDRIDQNQALARQDHESALQEARARTTEAMKLKMQEEARQSLRQRTAEQNTAVEEQAPAVTRARELASATQRAPSMDGNVLDTIKSRLTPEQMTKYYGVDNSPVAKLDDKLGIARTGGMYEAEDMLTSARKETVAAMTAAHKEAVDQARLAQGERKLDLTEDKTDKQFKAQMARIDASDKRQSGGDSQAAVEKLTTEKARQLQELSILMKDGNKKVDGPRIEQIKANLVDLDDMLRARRTPGEGAAPKPAPAASPAPAAPAKPVAPAANTPGWSIKKK